MTEILKEVGELETALTDLRSAASPERATDSINSTMAEFDAKFAQVVAPNALAAMRAEHEHGTREAYDGQLRTQASVLEQRHLATLTALKSVIETLKQVPREKDPMVDATRESSALQRYSGRTRADLLRAYEATPDKANPTLVHLIESDLAAFRLVDDPDHDVDVVQRFKWAIEQRQDARVPPDIYAAAVKVTGLLRSLNVSHLLEHLRSGRGVATMQRLHLVNE